MALVNCNITFASFGREEGLLALGLIYSWIMSHSFLQNSLMPHQAESHRTFLTPSPTVSKPDISAIAAIYRSPISYPQGQVVYQLLGNAECLPDARMWQICDPITWSLMYSAGGVLQRPVTSTMLTLSSLGLGT